MTYSKVDLNEKGAKPMAIWLIEAALNGGDLSYEDAKTRIQKKLNFTKIFSTHMGGPAGQLMHDIQRIEKDAPLLNVLLVRSGDRLPGEGAGSFMAERFNEPRLAEKGIRSSNPALWRKYFEKAANEVYAFKSWPALFKKAYNEEYRQSSDPLSPFDPSAGTEEDGNKFGRGGEGENHKFLRLWVKAHPEQVISKSNVRAETEVPLKSGDRVDVVYFSKNTLVAVEVKSKDSNDVDLQRGIYQCVKYRAVLQAMNPRLSSDVTAILVTEQALPGHLKELAKRLDVPHKLVSPRPDS